jgi:hypothetical protein
VRRGTATFHHGVDERVLTPAGRTSRRDDPTAAWPSPTESRRSTPAKQAAPRQAGPRQPQGKAGARAASRPATKATADPQSGAKDARRERELRKQVNRLEKQWEQAEAKVAELQQALADPDVYADPERLTSLTTALDGAKDDAVRLMTEWEQAASRLERLS